MAGTVVAGIPRVNEMREAHDENSLSVAEMQQLIPASNGKRPTRAVSRYFASERKLSFQINRNNLFVSLGELAPLF